MRHTVPQKCELFRIDCDNVIDNSRKITGVSHPLFFESIEIAGKLRNLTPRFTPCARPRRPVRHACPAFGVPRQPAPAEAGCECHMARRAVAVRLDVLDYLTSSVMLVACTGGARPQSSRSALSRRTRCDLCRLCVVTDAALSGPSSEATGPGADVN